MPYWILLHLRRKTYFNYPNKYYFTDVGLRNARLNYRQYDPGHIMENIIYNELVKRGYSVNVGVVTERTKKERIQREIDFVVNDGDRRSYIQSAYQMDTVQKENSELRSLSLTNERQASPFMFSVSFYICESLNKRTSTSNKKQLPDSTR